MMLRSSSAGSANTEDSGRENLRSDGVRDDIIKNSNRFIACIETHGGFARNGMNRKMAWYVVVVLCIEMRTQKDHGL
ncbi:MAG: hypothetical protein HGA43_09850 [Nitrospirae bacterium]|nr:hypothetical protein [Nitrospirota bacterium]